MTKRDLTNADFRSLLNASDRSVLTELTTHKKRRKVVTLDTDSKKVARKEKYLCIQKKQKHTSGNAVSSKFDSPDKLARSKKSVGEVFGEERTDILAGDSGSLAESVDLADYRDRAESRRQVEDEHAQITDEFKTQKERSIEESKYMGGDLSHTHLVKGLDFALLAKVRKELKDAPAQQTADLLKHLAAKDGMQLLESHGSSSSSSIKGAGVGVKSGGTASVNELRRKLWRLWEDIHPHNTAFETKLTRVQKILLQGAHFKSNTSNFLPGRMRLEYRLEDTIKSNTTTMSESEKRKALMRSSEQPPVAVYYSVKDCAHLVGGKDLGIVGSAGSLLAFVKPAILEEVKNATEQHRGIHTSSGTAATTMSQKKYRLSSASTAVA
eukprot:Lankesteria_metandrocarpae@DN1489_c0_g1_i1.p1